MSVRAPERVSEDPQRRLGEMPVRGDERVQAVAAAAEAKAKGDETPISVGLTCLSALLSTAAAGFVCAGLFPGIFPRLVGILGAGIGAGMVWLSYRARRTSAVQFLTVPVAVLAGTLLVVPDARGGTANLPSLVAEALRAGGVGQPPVPFDPGWRFLLVAFVIVLGAAAAALATGLNRPKLAVFLPVPVIFAALVAQSSQAGAAPVVGALALLVAALAVSFGVELVREGATSGGFELRRFGKGAAALSVVAAILAGLTQVGFLFPAPNQEQVIPPKRPEPSPPEPDRELFVVRSVRQLPWRAGVLDVYDGRGWLTPPFDARRLIPVPAAGVIALPAEGARPAGAPQGGVAGAQPRPGEPAAVEATFVITDVRGHVIPVIANLTRITREGFTVEYDPRTQTLRLPDRRAARGMTYTVEAPLPPRGQDLAKAAAPSPAMKEFLSAPPAPPEISDLLGQAPKADLFSRLQFVRQKLYEKVVAKGAGQPTDVPPERVVALLAGKPGTPFEITAAEALLARWVGVSSRIGYGYFGGDFKPHNEVSVRPRHAATWLEAYFQGYGWVPIVGTPPRAQSSLSSAEKNRNPSVRPSENLTLSAYVPVRLKSVRLLYVLVQYWAARTLPLVVVAILGMWLYPGLAKLIRRSRRRRWAGRGVADRIRIAYAEFRDVAHDFNIGYPAQTPLEFLSKTEVDTEHSEFAWLVSRCLWGDLARDLREEDAALAEEMGRSLSARLRAAQPAMNRLFAYASRNSLRDPFTEEIPNLWWPRPSLRSRVKQRARRSVSALRQLVSVAVSRPLRLARRGTTVAGAVLFITVLTSCVQSVDLASSASSALPRVIVPAKLGELSFEREPSSEQAFTKAGPDALVGAARVFSVRRGDNVVGALQVAAFKRAVSGRQREVRAGVLEGLGGPEFQLQRFGRELIYTQRLPELQRLLWFPTSGAYYELFIARSDFDEAAEVFADILAYQRGERANEVVVLRADPRRGSDG